MKKVKLSKLKNDIDFIDPVTMQKVCSFNQCVNKFTEEGSEEITTYPKWKDGAPLIKTTHYHLCNECGRKHRSKADKSKNVHSFYEAAAGGGNPLNRKETT